MWQPKQPKTSKKFSAWAAFSDPGTRSWSMWHLKQVASMYRDGSMGKSQCVGSSQSYFWRHSSSCSTVSGQWTARVKSTERSRPKWHVVQPNFSMGCGDVEPTYWCSDGWVAKGWSVS